MDSFPKGRDALAGRLYERDLCFVKRAFTMIFEEDTIKRYSERMIKIKWECQRRFNTRQQQEENQPGWDKRQPQRCNPGVVPIQQTAKEEYGDVYRVKKGFSGENPYTIAQCGFYRAKRISTCLTLSSVYVSSGTLVNSAFIR